MDKRCVEETAGCFSSCDRWDIACEISPAETPSHHGRFRRSLEGKIAKWWIPEAVEFVEELPHTATGKVQKVKLREIFKDFSFSG